MERQYSVQFFTSFVENLQQLCQNYLNFSQSVEISGYISVEIDNVKKERYVLSELLQSSGNVVSESFCVKGFETMHSARPPVNTSDSCGVRMAGDKKPRAGHYGTQEATLELPVKMESRNETASFPGYQSDVFTTNAGPSNFFQDTTNLAQECISLPQERVTVSLPQEHVSLQQERVSLPQERVSLPQERVSFPQERVSLPQERVSFPQERVSLPQERVSLPQERVSFPQEHVGLPQEHVGLLQEHVGLKQEHVSLPQECVSLQQEHNRLPQEHIRLPQKRLRGGSQSTVSRPSDSPEFPDDSVIDLDLIDDDFDLPMDESSQEDAGFRIPLQPAVSTIQSQQKLGPARSRSNILSPASLTTSKYTVKQFTRFHFNRSGQKLDLFTLPPETLDPMLILFYREAKKANGGDLKPRSLQNVQACLNRYLKDGGYPYSILKDEEFHGSRDMLKKRVAEILANSVPVCFDINEDDINVLFQKGLLGCSSAEVLINTMWFINTKCFKKTSPTEHMNMKWGDIVLKIADNGLESLVYQVNGAYRTVYAKPQHSNQCLVEFYKQYKKRRPRIARTGGSAFYLKVNSSTSGTDVFLPQGMTVVELEAVWRKLMKASRQPPNKKAS